jgi:hypothetical protein
MSGFQDLVLMRKVFQVLPSSTDLWTLTSENGSVRKKQSCAT